MPLLSVDHVVGVVGGDGDWCNTLTRNLSPTLALSKATFLRFHMLRVLPFASGKVRGGGG